MKISNQPENKKNDNETFDGQKPTEEIILQLKRHPMTMYKQGLILVAGLLLVIISLTWFGASRITSVVITLYLIAGGFYGFKTWYLWWSSHYILTNERVISVDQKGFFHRSVSEAALDKIQNVAYDIEGPYQTFLDFGTIKILTAGQKEADVEFSLVGHPYDVQKEITDAAHKFGNVIVEAEKELGKTIIR